MGLSVARREEEEKEEEEEEEEEKEEEVMPVLQSGDSFSTAVSLSDAAKRCAERTKDEVTAGTAYVPPPRPKPKAPPPAPKLGHDEERQMEEEVAKDAGWETVTGMARGPNNVHSPFPLLPPSLPPSLTHTHSLSLSLSLSLPTYVLQG